MRHGVRADQEEQTDVPADLNVEGRVMVAESFEGQMGGRWSEMQAARMTYGDARHKCSDEKCFLQFVTGTASTLDHKRMHGKKHHRVGSDFLYGCMELHGTGIARPHGYRY